MEGHEVFDAVDEEEVEGGRGVSILNVQEEVGRG